MLSAPYICGRYHNESSKLLDRPLIFFDLKEWNWSDVHTLSRTLSPRKSWSLSMASGCMATTEQQRLEDVVGEEAGSSSRWTPATASRAVLVFKPYSMKYTKKIQQILLTPIRKECRWPTKSQTLFSHRREYKLISRKRRNSIGPITSNHMSPTPSAYTKSEQVNI
jgi:hypothetical protein